MPKTPQNTQMPLTGNAKLQGSWLRQLGERIELKSGAVLATPDFIPTYCYYIRSGRIVSVVTTTDAQERMLLPYEPQQLILVQNVLTGRRCGVTYKAVTPVCLQRISYPELLRVMRGSFSVTLDVIEAITANSEAIIQKHLAQLEASAPMRVAGLLLDLAAAYGLDEDGMIQLSDRMTQQTLSELANLHRVTIARVLQQLRTCGLAYQQGGYYYISDLQGLTAFRDGHYKTEATANGTP